MDKTLKQIIILSIIVLLLFIGTVLLKNMTADKKFKWDYGKITFASEILNQGKKINDRNLYWHLKEIINNFLLTMQDEEDENIHSEETKKDYLEYYDVLSKEYKKQLNKDEYEKLAITFINKFLVENHLGYKYVSDYVIDDIYQYDDSMYLCVIVEKYTQVRGYIGIKMNEEQHKFSVFYIE